jgi:hypothetical protein
MSLAKRPTTTLTSMSNAAESSVTGPIETIAKGPRQRSWVALGAAIVGTVLAVVGLFASIISALVENNGVAGVTLVIFFVGLLLDLAAIVLAIIALVRTGPRRVVPWIAIAIALIPLFVYLMLVVVI